MKKTMREAAATTETTKMTMNKMAPANLTRMMTSSHQMTETRMTHPAHGTTEVLLPLVVSINLKEIDKPKLINVSTVVDYFIV